MLFEDSPAVADRQFGLFCCYLKQARNFRFQCGLVYVSEPGLVYLILFMKIVIPNYSKCTFEEKKNLVYAYVSVPTFRSYPLVLLNALACIQCVSLQSLSF